MRQIKKIAITNEKGGVGKTMTAVNLSACLAQRGYRVLLIDADPQGYATLNYDVAVSPSLLEVLRGQATCTETVQTTCFGVDVLPSDRTLSIIEEDLIRQEMNGAPYLNTLEKALEDLADYDFVIIDCPPQGGRLMDIVHYYADAIIMPMFAEDYGIHALTLKAEAIADIRRTINPNLKILGGLITMDERRGLRSVFREVLLGQDLLPMFNTTIRRNVALIRAVNVKDTTPHSFYLAYNSATMNVVDDPTTIRLTIKKKDSETNASVAQGNASLAGAQYKVTYVNGTKTVENIVTTNSSGSATLRGLPIGVTVTVQEITAPAGYKLDSRVHTYVTTTKTEKIEYDLEPEDFTEDVFKGHIQITKQIEMLGADAQLEQGAEYQVYLKSAGSYANAKDTERDYLVTGADGKATTKDLPYGTYTLHQVKGVPGREFKDLDVDVHENGKTYEVTLTNELKYAPLKIVKTSEDGNVAGFTFKVTRLADGYSKTYTTNAAGEIITDQMPVYVDADATQLYEYKVEEINVPDKYRTPDAQTVTLTYGQTAEVRFYNQIARGTLEILKVDHDGVTPLEGAKFEITDDDGNVIATETSGPDGKIKVDSILYGQYHWSEVMAPKGYDLDDTVHDFAIEHDEQVIEITQENTPSVGSITAKKVDANGNPMPGVEFTLEYSTDDGATWAPIEARAEDSKPSIGGCTSAVIDGTLETDENGVATFNGLQVDNQTVTITYRLTETGTKSGSTLLAAPMFIGSLPQVEDDGTEVTDVVVTAVNNQSFALPSSGGNGMASVPVGIALALISVSCFAAWLWKKKLF